MPFLIALLIVMLPQVAAPDLWGLATYYEPTGNVTRSGEPYSSDGARVAVDGSEWARLGGAWLFVFSPDTGLVAIVKVNDTGYLYGAGRFVDAGPFFVPAAEDPQGEGEGEGEDSPAGRETLPGDRVLRDQGGLQIVLDFPEYTFEEISPGRETVRVVAFGLQGVLGG